MKFKTEIRQRKSAPTAALTADKEDTKKTVVNSNNNNLIAALLFLVSLPVRFKNVALPAQVVFDEVHFGKYAAYYIRRSFFFDVHPPLAKLLIAFVAWISGFKGDFDFAEIGNVIPENVPYVQMRAFGALFGALIVPLSYLTIRDAGHSKIAATLTALAICFENGLITNNRLVLLDAYLLFFIAFTVFSWNRFYNLKRSFDRSWYFWLLCSGIGLGCTVSTKWVGLFTVATIGVSTIRQLWKILGDITVTKRLYALHFFSRAICLIIVPVSIYIGSFYIHLSILDRSGPGESYMEMQTQNELKGYYPIDTPRPIVYGSIITIRHLETTGGFLHSHKANYAEGSQQQQVTLYPHRDNNNWWRVLKSDNSEEPKNDLLASDNTTWLQYVRAGETIRLEHVETAPLKLHSHDIPAPVTDTDYNKEVSAYGFPNHEGDANDNWLLKIDEDSRIPEAGQFLQARRSKFRLMHTYQDCYLYASYERLPDWGYDQQEISCISEALKPKTMWQIDESQNPMLPENVVMEPEHRPDFLQKFLRLHKAMWTINSELTETHPFESRPHEWPLLLSVISFWQTETNQIILLGNPLVYWSSTVAVLTFFILYGFFQLRQKRGFKDSFGGLRAYYETSAGFFVMAWTFHYLPFFKMERQLFIHHYMPSLYFAVLTLGVGFDILLRRFPRVMKLGVLVLSSVCLIYTWWVYSPLAYSGEWSLAQCENASLLKSWGLSCETYTPLGSPERLIMENVEVTTKESEIVYDGEEEDKAEDSIPMPTDAPEPPEYEPEFIDGKEVVYEDDDEDEDEWPRTIYGVDPDADEDDEVTPLTVRKIPLTKHLDL
ncbi:Dolichyl-phosphate-mannose-protein mannosyltransferase-domain-containing protein [Mucor mucedo]|uniref:Dolichyl-phosphate-mannose-protein mannosyltransferase-domain-containing protein n=1 Tax=Mucor mucedo TaxID=29922 RepID=UPI00221E8C76|nr:Dolichyl-phosphate-mannose-protein mannosyltransferase-domain-containing protein [Mucor mucedo]KAI7894443.1 Dolichyl-phosphate-mannose-protein mannosyltransferase-domain-containing protein [Mucor mucedo]